jgi:hypothetical protein
VATLRTPLSYHYPYRSCQDYLRSVHGIVFSVALTSVCTWPLCLSLTFSSEDLLTRCTVRGQSHSGRPFTLQPSRSFTDYCRPCTEIFRAITVSFFFLDFIIVPEFLNSEIFISCFHAYWHFYVAERTNNCLRF